MTLSRSLWQAWVQKITQNIVVIPFTAVDSKYKGPQLGDKITIEVSQCWQLQADWTTFSMSRS